MKPKLKQLSEIIAEANDAFFVIHDHINTVVGIMDKSLRKQGMNADAVSIDCLSSKEKLVFVLHDIKPIMVDIALGNHEGDITSSYEYVLTDITVDWVVTLMKDHFIANK